MRGSGLVDLIATLAVGALLLLVATPALDRTRAEVRLSGAARRLMLELSRLRWTAVASGDSHGLRFERDEAGEWRWRVVRDGNGNGLRNAEIDAGVDRTLGEGGLPPAGEPAVRFGFPELDRPIRAIPPRRGTLDVSGGPVRVGRARLVSFSPLGRATSGTLYLTDGRRSLWAVVVYGRTARMRVWRYREGARRWTR